MELHQLRYFTFVAAMGSVSRAAAQAGIAQPSISQQLQKLERTLGYALFDRSRRKMILTDAGRALLPRARRIVADTDEIQRNFSREIDASAAHLSVGAIPTIAPFLLPRGIGAVRKAIPDCTIGVQEDLTENLVELLLDAEIDCALLASTPNQQGIDSRNIGREPMLAVIPSSWPLASRKQIGLADLRDLPMISLHEMHCLGQQVSMFCELRRLRPLIVCRTTQLTTILDLVGLGLGMSLVPAMAARNDSSPLRKYLAIQGGPSRPIVASLRRGTIPRDQFAAAEDWGDEDRRLLNRPRGLRERLLHGVQFDCSRIPAAIDEERGRSAHAAVLSAVEMFAHPPRPGVGFHLPSEAIDLEPQLQGQVGEIDVFEILLMFEERFVHVPESPLFARRLGRHRRDTGAGMHRAPGKVPEDKLQPIAETRPQLFDDRLRVEAIGAFVIPIFDERDRRIRRAERVIGLGDGDRQIHRIVGGELHLVPQAL